MTDKQPQNPLYEQITPTTPSQELRRPLRELIVGGIGFVVFVTVLTFVMNWVGIPQLQAFIKEAGALAPLAYIVLKALTYVFAPLTSGPVQVIAGTLFDSVWLGVLYTLIGEVIGGSISFFIARRFGRPMVSRMVGTSGMAQIDDFINNRLGGWQSLALARLVLFSLWDFISYGVGLTTIRYRTYLWVSIVIGSIPTLAFVWLGDSVLSDASALIWVYGLVALLILVPALFHKQVGQLLARASGKNKADTAQQVEEA